jgi:Zn ribbon nucleic-acid-binding protein
MGSRALIGTELWREDIVRDRQCPTCGAAAQTRCLAPPSATGRKRRSDISHTSRYNLAAEAGLVPRLGGT